jgi:uncharacterized integral membrane protein
MNMGIRVKHWASSWVILVVLLLSLLLLVDGAAAQDSISYVAYLSRIGRWREQVRMQGQDVANCTQVLAQVADEMGEVTAVQMPNDTIMTVNHEGIIASLRATPCNPAHADSLLAGICPAHVCLVGENPNLDNSPPLGTSSSAPAGDLPPGLVQELVDRLQEGVGDGSASDGSGEQLPGGDAPSGGASGSPVGTGGTGAEQAPGAGGETSDPGAGTGGAGDPSGGSDIVGGDGSGDVGGGDSVVTDDGLGGTGSSDTSNGADGGGETVVSPPAAAPEAPPAVAPPPEIGPPVATERPLWLWVVVGIALAVLLVGGGMLLWTEDGGGEPKVKRAKAEPATSEEAVDVGRVLIAAGNYRGAVRHLFLAALLTLDERHLIQYDTTRTNYELLAGTVLRRPAIVETLLPVIETFERVWYGFETVGSGEYERLAGQIELLKQV